MTTLSTICSFKILQYLPTFSAFPFGLSTCVLSALPTSPWSDRPRPPSSTSYTLWETATWLVLFLFHFRICCFTWKHISSKFATFSLSCSWQKSDRALGHAASRQKKSLSTKRRLLASVMAPHEDNWIFPSFLLASLLSIKPASKIFMRRCNSTTRIHGYWPREWKCQPTSNSVFLLCAAYMPRRLQGRWNRSETHRRNEKRVWKTDLRVHSNVLHLSVSGKVKDGLSNFSTRLNCKNFQ